MARSHSSPSAPTTAWRSTTYATCGRELARRGVYVPIFIGGKLNRIPDSSNTSLPVDVGAEIGEAGAIVCRHPNDMLDRLTEMALERLSTTLERTA